MKIWQVWDGDYDSQWVVATYDSEALARAHAETYGLNVVEEAEVLSTLTPDAADPQLQAQRADKRAADAAEARRRYEEAQVSDARQKEWRQSRTIEQQKRPSLCSCRVFMKHRDWISPHGHCGYCSGWTPEVFRSALGESALAAEIDKLAIHNRITMREICGLAPVESL